MPCKVFAMASQKGGVGKTTTAVNVSASLNSLNIPTLLVDFDPQSNASSSFGIKRSNHAPDVYDCLMGLSSVEESIVKTPYGDILPASINLVGAEIALVSEEEREYRLKKVLEPVKNRYSCIIIDCAPSLGILMLNGMCAADGVIIPIQCEYLALEGLSLTIDTIRTIRRKMNPSLELSGLVFTMYDGRTNLSSQVAHEVKKHFSDKIYKTVIPRNVRLSEAPSHGMPVKYYDKSSKGAQSYDALAMEIAKLEKLATVKS